MRTIIKRCSKNGAQEEKGKSYNNLTSCLILRLSLVDTKSFASVLLLGNTAFGSCLFWTPIIHIVSWYHDFLSLEKPQMLHNVFFKMYSPRKELSKSKMNFSLSQLIFLLSVSLYQL